MSVPRPGTPAGPARRTRARRGVALALVLGALAAATPTRVPADAPRPITGRAAYADTFPAGPGLRIAEISCLACHSPMMVHQQAKDSAAWEKTISTMKTFGAAFTDAERDTLRDYLLANFGPRRKR